VTGAQAAGNENRELCVVCVLLWDVPGASSIAASWGWGPHLVVHLPRQVLQLLSRVLEALPLNMVMGSVRQKLM